MKIGDNICETEAIVPKSKQLVRSHAFCGDDDTKLNVTGQEKQSSSKSSGVWSLSRGSSNELYKDPDTGVNLETFITKTLHKNCRDREFILYLENVILQFVQDNSRTLHRFESMSSYNRMLVHRISAFFGLDHNVDQTGSVVVLTKSKGFRIPETKFKDYIKDDIFTDEPIKGFIKRVPSYDTPQQDLSVDARKARSFDEREQNYENVRSRIFNHGTSSVDRACDSPARPLSGSESKSESGFQHMRGATRKSQSGKMGHKAGSYSGSSMLFRQQYEMPSGVGPKAYDPMYGQTAQMPIFDMQHAQYFSSTQPVIFAVSSLAQVPPGAFLIHPATGQPFVNPDGSVYRHDVQPCPEGQLGAAGGLLPYDVSALTGDFQQLSTPAAYFGVPSPGVGDPTAGGGAMGVQQSIGGTVFYNAPWANVPRSYPAYMMPVQPPVDSIELLPQSANVLPHSSNVYMQGLPVQYHAPAVAYHSSVDYNQLMGDVSLQQQVPQQPVALAPSPSTSSGVIPVVNRPFSDDAGVSVNFHPTSSSGKN